MWADAISQTIVLAVMAAAAFGGVVYFGYWLLGQWLD